jgi:hypothetical protein
MGAYIVTNSESHRLIFDTLEIGKAYTRSELSDIWHYKSFHAIRRGVVTERNSKNVVVFITAKKDNVTTAYKDSLDGDCLKMQGQESHLTDNSLADYESNVYLFYREERKTNNKSNPFVYYGRMKLVKINLNDNGPSNFIFKIIG